VTTLYTSTYHDYRQMGQNNPLEITKKIFPT
jgi:hypothetical protein